MTPMNPEKLAQTILKESGKKIVSSGEMKFLCDKQREWKEARASGDYHTFAQSQADFMAHQRTMLEAVRAGTIKQTYHRTNEDYRKEYAQKASTCYEQCRLIAQGVLPLAGEIAERFCDIAKKFADDARKSEQAEHERFGVPYTGPSALIVWFGKAADMVRARAQASPYQVASPEQILPYLDLTEK
jgi:hypothetical protein